MKKIQALLLFCAIAVFSITSCEATKDGFKTPDGVTHTAPPPPPPPGATQINNAAKKLFKKVPPPPTPSNSN